MRNVRAPKTIDTWRIVCASQSEPDYDESRWMLTYGGARGTYYGNGPFVLLEGGHCSCYDWEDVDWWATEYEYDELVTLARSRVDGATYCSKAERLFWRAVLHAIGGEHE